MRWRPSKADTNSSMHGSSDADVCTDPAENGAQGKKREEETAKHHCRRAHLETSLLHPLFTPSCTRHRNGGRSIARKTSPQKETDVWKNGGTRSNDGAPTCRQANRHGISLHDEEKKRCAVAIIFAPAFRLHRKSSGAHNQNRTRHAKT